MSTNSVISVGHDRLVNLRDVGGLPLVGGGLTRRDVLYRGDAPYPGDAAPDGVAVWPPATVIDLRSRTERERVGYVWSARTAIHRIALHDEAAPTQALSSSLQELYGRMLDAAGPRVAGATSVVARARGPIFVHCAAGKDRTGLVVAALLLAAGAEPHAVVSDYTSTADNMAALRDRWKAKGLGRDSGRPIPEEFLLAPVEAISVVVDTLTNWPGGAGKWLTDHGADPDDVRAWRLRIRAVDSSTTSEREAS
ncbi:Protein tyrosine phosphatase [Rhodococcus wratislaviensis]|jgi:hypothetical protein|uniref:Protein tyrosine phosphatase n=1 Tax=Rhodococcus wratislaviensis TaxID=44752 RepID=A0A402CL58_RHOWR|nr:tyrosine-protein phosphatase [Rhodococcus wratislaviensis]GCE44324.1 Protein tyrosine phosphatase [Rhodococcus wratislaviensis]